MNGWTVPAVAIFLLTQASAAVWWASGTDNQVGNNTNIILLEVLIISTVLIIFGEILPKTLAMRFSKSFANLF